MKGIIIENTDLEDHKPDEGPSTDEREPFTDDRIRGEDILNSSVQKRGSGDAELESIAPKLKKLLHSGNHPDSAEKIVIPTGNGLVRDAASNMKNPTAYDQEISESVKETLNSVQAAKLKLLTDFIESGYGADYRAGKSAKQTEGSPRSIPNSDQDQGE